MRKEEEEGAGVRGINRRDFQEKPVTIGGITSNANRPARQRCTGYTKNRQAGIACYRFAHLPGNERPPRHGIHLFK